jgi:hypothetical protein
MTFKGSPPRRKGEAGFTLVETVLALALLPLILIGALGFFWLQVHALDQKIQKGRARDWASSGVGALAARTPSELPAQSSFTLAADNSVQVQAPCTNATCDQVFDPAPPLAERTSAAGGVPYDRPVPEGTRRLFVRRWNVEDVDPARGLRRFTLALLADEQATRTVIVRREEAAVLSR